MKSRTLAGAVLTLALLVLPSLALAAPVIKGVTPTNSSNLLRTIWGSGFQTGAKVFIGGTLVSAVWQGGSAFLVFQAPTGGSGTSDILVTNPDGSSAKLPGGFTYSSSAATPVVRGVAPMDGSTFLLTAWGSNFDTGAQVYVNNVAALSQWQIGTQYIVFQPPQGSGANAKVEVRNPSGESGRLTVNLTVGTGPIGTNTTTANNGTTQNTTNTGTQTTTTGGGTTVPQTSIPFGSTPCTKYVAKSGSLSANTTNAPVYTSIQAGVSASVAGDTLCVAPGSYQEVVKVTNSGTSASPITIRAVDQYNKPIVDGGYVVPTGPAYSCYEYSAEALAATQAVVPGYYAKGIDPNASAGPYPKLACGTGSGTNGSMLVLIQANNIIWDSIDITRSRGVGLLLGNGIGDGFRNTPCSGAAECAWYSNIKFLRSNVSHVRGTGIFIVQADNVLFDGGSMEESNNTAAYEKAAALSDQTAYSLIGWGNGIRITGTNITIANSRIFHNWGEALSIDVRDGDTWGPDKNITIAHNEVYDNWPGNIYLDAVDNINVTGNIFYDTGAAQFKAPEWGNGDPFNVVIETEHGGYGATNLLFANNIVSGGSSNLSLQQYQGNTHYANLHFFNNTFLNPQDGALSGGFVNSTDIELVNNIFYAPGKPIFSSYSGFTSRADLVFSHNLWSSSPVSVQAPTNGTTDPQANLNGAGDVITSNPGFANPSYAPTPGNFDTSAIKLVTGSRALNAGNNLSSVTDDFFGTARPNGLYDIGAYQH